MNQSSPSDTPEHAGHRERLKERFAAAPAELSEADLLELLLGYAIPRRDVAPLAGLLLQHYQSIDRILAAPLAELTHISGIGPSTAVFLKLIHQVLMKKPASQQLSFLNPEELEDRPLEKAPTQRTLRVFTNDEVANALHFLPKVAGFTRLDAFKEFLQNNLPYNSQETRQRRAVTILNRFYPEGTIAAPLTTFLSQISAENSLKPVIFYHMLQSEPIAVKTAEELIYPALPIGQVGREQLREFTRKVLPDISPKSMAHTLRSFDLTYSLLGVGTLSADSLRFQLRPGDPMAFAYIFTAEFPQPGMYSFDQLYQGPLHRWLLWDREWLRAQLYALRDMGILSKISEIDAVKQFTVALDRSAALQAFLEAVRTAPHLLREKTDDPDSKPPLHAEDPTP